MQVSKNNSNSVVVSVLFYRFYITSVLDSVLELIS